MSKPEGKKKPDAPKTKIDASKAMVIMGFKTSRTLEVAGFDERRQILDAQLFTRMQEVQVNIYTIHIIALIRDYSLLLYTKFLNVLSIVYTSIVKKIILFLKIIL